MCDSSVSATPSTSSNVVTEVNAMRLGPYRGYYGRAAWNDATQRFEGWIICPERVKFHSVKEKNIVLNFQKCVTKYVEEQEECLIN